MANARKKKRRFEWLDFGLIGIMFFAVLALIWGKTKNPESERKIASVSQRPLTTPDLNKFLRENQTADIYGKLDAKGKNMLAGLVHGHCEVRYDADSCAHYLITCGRPCLADISESSRKRFANYYITRRQQFGLPAME